MRSIQRTLAMAMTLACGAVFLPLGCGGSMPNFDPAAPPHSDGDLPDDIAREVRTCTAEHITHLGTADHSIAFDVKLDSDGEVDSVALIATTIRDDDLLVCMVRALRSLTEDDLPLRSGKRSGGVVTPESRALAGQFVEGGLAAACLAAPAGCVLVLGITAIGGAVYVYVFTHPSTKPGPIHHHPPPTVEEPTPTAVPAPTTVAPPVATTMPMATLAPTATAPPMPIPGTRTRPNQTCDDARLAVLIAAKKAACSVAFSCSDETERIGRKKEKRLECPEILARIAAAKACKAARIQEQIECFAGSPDKGHDDQIEMIDTALKVCIAKKVARGC